MMFSERNLTIAAIFRFLAAWSGPLSVVSQKMKMLRVPNVPFLGWMSSLSECHHISFQGKSWPTPYSCFPFIARFLTFWLHWFDLFELLLLYRLILTSWCLVSNVEGWDEVVMQVCINAWQVLSCKALAPFQSANQKNQSKSLFR